MGMFYAYGGALIDEDEILAKTESGEFASFSHHASDSPADAALEFSTGRLTVADLRGSMVSPVATRTPFEPIGIGKPLTIEIRHVYTGRFPKRNLFRRSADMIVTSAIKSSPVLGEATTAVNLLRRNVAAHSGFSTPHADELGTPVVFYSPALTQRNSSLTIKFGFDEFPGDEFQQFAEVLSSAAGLPLFAPASLHLHGASAIATLVGRLGDTLFDRRAAFRATEGITFARPGSTIPVANFALMMQDDEDERQVLKTHVISGGKLTHAETGRPYDGDIPYVVISLDGRCNDELNHFMSQSAVSLMLSDLTSDAGFDSAHMDELREAVEIYHDYRLRRRADRVGEKLSMRSPDAADFQQLATEYDALVANINAEALKPTGIQRTGEDRQAA
ncbi:hypothetical protein K227x_60730 [Rubripirellula lacrimiformis]|uniref:Uncharacterized protein n=1 Tax=Rubripirellula lacrimiformis TaxID=1930273 RepID=A0A517NKH5_9BACT|nr:hypothetical protein [Rubripirellula lacrimiformis]QDT07645.1 hypothetical protein K227x_60730 [Rubripirellula lacrimiformis]